MNMQYNSTETLVGSSLQPDCCASPDMVRETAKLIVRVAKRRAMKPEYMADIVAKLCAGTVRERAGHNEKAQRSLPGGDAGRKE